MLILTLIISLYCDCFSLGEQVKILNDKSNNVRIIQNDQRTDTCEFQLDQSKRMVTIRRINVPHAEPQVTVTAKGISPDKDKLLYTFINGQLIPSAAVATASPSVTSTNTNEKVDKLAKAKQNAKTESTLNAKIVKKPTEAAVLPDKNAKKNPKEKPAEKNTKPIEKNVVRKPSPDNSKSVAVKSVKSTTNIAPNTTKEKEKEKQKQKKGKKEVEQEVETIINSTKELAISEEKPKKEKKKEKKAVKFEYADPNYKVNQFDLLDMDEDDDYYIESSSEESSDDEPEPVPVPRPTAVVTANKPNPPLSNQSSIESQSAQITKSNKNPPPTKNAKAVEATKKGKNDANAKAQPQKSDKKPSIESATAASTKPLKSQNNPAQPPQVAAGKQNTIADDSSNLSKKQKKKLEKKQNAAQTQQQPSTARTTSRAVSLNQLLLWQLMIFSNAYNQKSCRCLNLRILISMR